ncbi:hypothetical protein C0583_01440 [Candidatus Parcubacteria bacterium]|nr:MAG: hypothetical protein C0583_01440 [Candidatus Parcubacteria bacterium]
MTLKQRKILYFTFLLAFFIITPTLIFYALGYNLDSGFKIQKSGILVIDTEPNGAKIYINDEAAQKLWGKIIKDESSYIKTPAKIKGISPGEYEIRVELEGRWSWEKKLEIKPGQTTFAEDIYLFKNDESSFVSNLSINDIYISPDNRYMANRTENTIKLYNLDNNTQNEFLLNKDIYQDIGAWSYNSKKFLYSNFFFKVNEWEEAQNISDIISDNSEYIAWDYNNSNNLYFYLNGKLFLYSFSNNSTQELLENNYIQSFIIKNNYIYIIEKNGSKNTLKVLDQNTLNLVASTDLPYSDYEFIKIDHRLINLIDSKHQILYLIDPFSNIRPLIDVLYGIEYLDWVYDEKMIFSNGHEIWLFSLDNLEKKLLTRISEKITDLKWHPSDNYILFSTVEGVYILELDNREKRSITKIINTTGIEEMILNKKGNILYYTTTAEDKKTLYKSFIQ